MRKTPQQFKRVAVKDIIDKVLGTSKTQLNPLSIFVKEDPSSDYTTTDFSFSISGHTNQVVELKNQHGNGFIHGLFRGLHQYFSKDFQSLEKIKLVDLKVNPLMSNSRTTTRADAKTSVLFSVHVAKNGLAEFQHESRSLVGSSFFLALEAFQFYINCERCFYKIQMVIEDAQKRNRGDIISSSMYDLSKLTEVNTYETKEAN